MVRGQLLAIRQLHRYICIIHSGIYGCKFKPYFVQKFPNENYKEFKKDTQKDLELLISTIPYFGGFKNIFTQYLVSAPLVVAIYKNIKPLGIEDEEFGEFIFETVGKYLTPKRKLTKIIAKALAVGWLGKRLNKKNANKPVLYEYEWKFDIIEDKNDKDLIYTMKYNQCGLQKYMEDLGYSHLTPYLCISDYKLLSNLILDLNVHKLLLWVALIVIFNSERINRHQRHGTLKNLMIIENL